MLVTLFDAFPHLTGKPMSKLMAPKDAEKEAQEERIHFQNVVTAFQQYAPYTVCSCALHPRSNTQSRVDS